MIKVLKNKIVYILIFVCMLFAVAGGVDAVESRSLQWMDHSTYLDVEADVAWVHPELYVGVTAKLDTLTYPSFTLGSVVDGNIVKAEKEGVLGDEEATRSDAVEVRVNIVDYFVDKTKNDLWYKVEAAEGYTLPQAFEDNPYVLYLTGYSVDGFCRPATMHMLPKQAMPRYDELIINTNTTAASVHIILSKEQMPSFFDVEYVYVYESGISWYGYEIEDISKWDESFSSDYKYVAQNDVLLIPAVVSACYDRLMDAESSQEYQDILDTIPEEILDMFSPVHKEEVEDQEKELIRLENIEYTTTTTINGVEVPVTVKGKIPETGVKLSVTPVDNDTVVREGFKIREMADIVVALDIKIINTDDDSEWQPEEGNYIDVSIGMEALGYDDGRIFELQHKHGDTIDYYEIFVVMDGKLTINVSGFSIFTVSQPLGTANATRVGNNGTNITMTVGETKVFYFTTQNNGVNQNAPGRPSKWAVSDPAGAVYYTVHAEGGTRNDGVNAPWIKVTALKPTCESMSTTGNPVNDTPVELRAQWNDNRAGALSKLTITPPKATAGVDNGKKLYLKDTVNTSGKITATLVDTNGREITDGLAGAAFTWTRSDDMFITPRAYADNYQSVNIAIDHAGLVEARKEDGEYELVTYTLKATLADGNTLTAQYTVYYQSEILNASFENPSGTSSNYTFFVNGAPNLYWKTTAPGTEGNLTRDIEIANFNNGTCSQSFGVNKASEGIQFAELNAEEFGALYQDIISAPGENIDWGFAHAPRDATNFGNHNFNNSMFIVIGATEDAQKLTTSDQVIALGSAAKTAGAGNSQFLSGQEGIEVTYGGAKYKVWYHDAGHARDNSTQYVWTDLEGEYKVPENQYRTRLFFISEPNTRVVSNSTNRNGGNLIDKASAGQYKDVLIEYYEESYGESETISLTHLTKYDQVKKALVYSNMDIEYLDDLEYGERHDYLHRILINGSVYPYDVRYSGSPSIYIENYPEDKVNAPLTDPYPSSGKNYADYDIVVQIYVRDTVIAMQKILEFPYVAELDTNGEEKLDANGKVIKEKELLTIEQKLNLMASLANGYEVDLKVYTEENGAYVPNVADITIKNPDPGGNYTGYITPDNNPLLGYRYRVEETDITELPGLELAKVRFDVHGYRYGANGHVMRVSSSTITLLNDDENKALVSPVIKINDYDIDDPNDPDYGYKIADVIITNTYVEKETVIEYKAVGNGKVAFIGVSGSDLDFVDTPTETLAYYSGKAKGAAVHPGKGATFVGWFKDERCREEDRVTAADGVWDDKGNFKPNANILNAEKVTFYAKFVSGTVTINRTNAEPGEIFVYHVTSNKGLDIYVSIECDQTGKGSKTISEIVDAEYTVTEVTDFSWRYPDPINSDNSTIETTIKKINPDSASGAPLEYIFNFNGKEKHIYWVNGFSDIKKNIYKNLFGGS